MNPSDAALPATPVDPVDRIERAIPVEPLEPLEPLDPSASPADLPGEIRPAIPVDPSIPAPGVPAPAPAESPEPSPTSSPSAEPAASPSAESEAEPGAEPAETSPEATPAATAPPGAEGLDPHPREIRLSPETKTVPVDLAQFLFANDLYTHKQYEKAAPEYELYLKLYPGGSDRQAVFFRLAECYRQTGSLNAAQRNYEALIYTFRSGDFIGPASYRLGEMHYQQKEYSLAASFFRKASVWVKDPALISSAKFYTARSLEAAKMTSEAIRAYVDVLAIEGENPFREASQLALVPLLSDSGRRTEALRLLDALRQTTKKESLKAEATVRIGLLYLDQKENKKAAAELTQALAMPELGLWKEIAELALLRVHYREGEYEEVLKAYKASADAGTFSDAALPEALLLVANSQRQLRRYPDARTLYEQILQDYPQSPYAAEAQYERLVILYTIDSPELGPEIDAYLASHPDEGERRDQLTLMKAEAFYKAKKFVEAIPLYASLQKSSLAPALKAEALFKLGWCQMQTSDHAAAVESFSAFLSRYPTHKLAASALAQRGFGHERTGDYKAALADFDTVLSRYPRASEREFALQRKALILGQRDETRAMVESFRQLLKEFPKSRAAGQANYWIGLSAIQAKDYKEALAPLRAARKLDADFADRATSLLLTALFYQEERDALAGEVDQTGAKIRVPAEMLRWLGNAYLKDEGSGKEEDAAPGKEEEGSAARAEKYLARLVGLEGTDDVLPADWLSLGKARIKLRKWDAARKALGTYLERATDPIPQANGYLALGEVELGAGKMEEALRCAHKVQELQPEGRYNALGRMLSGKVAAAKGEWENAAKLYLSVALLYDDPAITPQSLERAYEAYRSGGMETEARKVLNNLQSRYPEYPLTKPVGNAR